MLRWVYLWLAHEDAISKADLIFVLAGLQSRKEYAVTLFKEAIAPRVLFSVGRFEIRRFSTVPLPLPPALDLLQIATNISPPERHFFVLLQGEEFKVRRIPVRKLGTLSEIDALADWLLHHPEITSLLLVSSGTHLRRVRLCCRLLLSPDVKIYLRATPRGVSPTNGGEPREPESELKKIVLELAKIICYALFLPVWGIARRWRSKTIHTVYP